MTDADLTRFLDAQDQIYEQVVVAASNDTDRALFARALDQFYRGEPDRRTLELLGPKI